MSALDQYTGGAPTDRHLPTRHDILNIYLGGGLLFNSVNEVHGKPSNFKTRFCTELICQMQERGGWQIVLDREGRITSDAIETLGGNSKHPKLIYAGNDPFALHIGRVFSLCVDLVHAIRCKDVDAIIKKLLAKKPAKKLVEDYTARLGFISSTTPALLAKAFKTTRKDGQKTVPVWNTHLLLPEHRSEILIVVDSITALAATTEITGDKPKAKGDNAIEQIIREGRDSSRAMGQQAREWSTFFRCQTWLDSHVCMLVVSQLRKTGFGGGMVYDKAAQPSANDYYGRTRLSFTSSNSGLVYMHPSGEGMYLGDNQSLTVEQRDTPIGRRVWINAKKTSGAKSVGFKIPAFMLGRSGLDRPNTVWEYLRHEKLISHSSAGRWKTVGGEREETFTRNEFVETLYSAEIDLWSQMIKTRISQKTLSKSK